MEAFQAFLVTYLNQIGNSAGNLKFLFPFFLPISLSMQAEVEMAQSLDKRFYSKETGEIHNL